MKKVLAISILIVYFLGISGAAKAESWSDNFDDNVIGPQWHLVSDGNSKSTLTESGGVLNFTANGLIAGEYTDKNLSLWQAPLALDKDFQFSVQFYNNSLAGGVGLGVVTVDGLHQVLYHAGINASDNVNGVSGNSFIARVQDGSNNSMFSWAESRNADGWLSLQYNAASDILEFKGYDINNNLLGDTSYSGYKSHISGLGQGIVTYASIGGYTATSTGKDMTASLDNFSGTGTVTPEPVSSALFLLGGAAFMLRRFRKKSSKII